MQNQTPAEDATAKAGITTEQALDLLEAADPAGSFIVTASAHSHFDFKSRMRTSSYAVAHFRENTTEMNFRVDSDDSLQDLVNKAIALLEIKTISAQ